MSDTAQTLSRAFDAASPARVRDYVDLLKPRVMSLVVFTGLVGVMIAPGHLHPFTAALAVLAIALGSGAAGCINRWYERDLDALMARTANRPLPAGRFDPDAALLFGVALAVLGLVELAFFVNLLTALLGAVALAGYVFLYTPLKRVTSLSTVIGAVPGAIPPMMGWSAVRGELDPAAWALFGILFFWQMPHFLAIAWLCREDYAAAGFPMLTVNDPEGRRTAQQAILYCAPLIPVSLLPSVLGLMGMVYFVGALALGLAYLGFAFGFARNRSTAGARGLMFSSLLYFPGVLLVMLLDRIVS
jgi:protoheme IX farnesyltransferase